MLKYNDNTINDCCNDGSELKKIYYHNAVCYYKLSSTPPTPPLPYDAQVEYLESSGSQYINTGVYLNTSNFEIGCSVADTYCLWGYCHQNVANGTWLSIECTSSQKTAFFGRFGSNYMVNMTSYIQSSGNTFVYKQNGITVNGTTISKSLSIGSDNIANVPLIFFGRYDFYKRGVEWIDNSKFKSFYVKNNNELVVDMIPVRVGQVGYMYDRVSGELFSNAGTGQFILGPDV